MRLGPDTAARVREAEAGSRGQASLVNAGSRVCGSPGIPALPSPQAWARGRPPTSPILSPPWRSRRKSLCLLSDPRGCDLSVTLALPAAFLTPRGHSLWENKANKRRGRRTDQHRVHLRSILTKLEPPPLDLGGRGQPSGHLLRCHRVRGCHRSPES